MSDIDLTPEALERKLDALKNGVEETETPATSQEKTLEEINLERDARLQKAADSEYVELAEARHLFDVDEILSDALKPRKLLLPELGADSFHVFYCPLNSVDRVNVMKIEDKNFDVQIDLRNRKALHIMLSKADERCTEAVVRRMPAAWIDVILTKISAEQRSFLSPLVRSVLSGLGPTSRPRRKRS